MIFFLFVLISGILIWNSKVFEEIEQLYVAESVGNIPPVLGSGVINYILHKLFKGNLLCISQVNNENVSFEF